VPVVTSPRACGSLSAKPGDELLVGDTPAETARQVLRLFEENGLAGRLRAAGLDYVRRDHDWTVIGRCLTGIYDDAREAWSRLLPDRALR